MTTPKHGAPAPSPPSRTPTLDLCRWRRTKGISLEDIADRTKISLRFLRAIEAEDFGQLPGGIFNTSYLRQYAAAIGFDESELLAHYDDAVNVRCPSNDIGPVRRARRGFFDRWLR